MEDSKSPLDTEIHRSREEHENGRAHDLWKQHTLHQAVGRIFRYSESNCDQKEESVSSRMCQEENQSTCKLSNSYLMYKLFKLMEAKGEIPPEPYPGAYGRPPDPTYQEFCQQFYGEPSSREYRSPPNLETSQKMRQLLEAVREGKTIVYHEIRSEPRVYTKEQLVDLLVQRADLLSLRGFSRSSEIVYVKDQKEVKVEEESNHNLDYLD